MKLSPNISNELRQIAPAVANIGNNNPYTVPMGYFDSLAADIIKNIKPETVVVSTNPYTAPTGYFDGLASSILSKIKANELSRNKEIMLELEKIAPLLNTINSKNILSVPDGYFETLSIHIPKEIKEPKVVPFGSGKSKWISYAAAASIIFILSASSYLYINQHMKSVDKSLTIEQRLATLDDDEIFNYLQNDLGDPDPDNATLIEEDPKINNLLINISDEEFERFYLDEENLDSDTGEEIIKGI
jgi:hypothetical protein